MANASLRTARDISIPVRSENSASERRITPSWSIAQLKAKLESVTGIPPSYQILSLKLPGQDDVKIIASDEEVVQIGQWSLQAASELYVSDTRPPSARVDLNLDGSSVPKYVMPEETYESLPDTVRAFKKAHKIGRFDPEAPELEKRKEVEIWHEVEDRGIQVSKRICLLPSTTRRGTVAFVGAIPTLPGPKGSPWIGVVLDEPQGKNDGSVGGERYFECAPNHGVFVRPDRCEVGDWGKLLDEDDEDLEEI
ncbi:hypothetical protein MMC25_000990 [Agyrium rufum]|nr:hypothetical protein [Agyrium rufum]